MDFEETLRRLADGDDGALGRLLSHACERLRRLTRKMLRGYPRLRELEETDDVLNNALIRLSRSLLELRPLSEEAFFRLAALNVRRELIDLTRHYLGPHGDGARLTSLAAEAGATEPLDPWTPERLARWREFHEQVERLPDEARRLIDLHFYHGLTQVEIAGRLEVTPRTVANRLAATYRSLHEALEGERPE